MEHREREQVVAEYFEEVRAYSDAVKLLKGLTGQAFTEAYARVEKLHARCEAVRARLDSLEKKPKLILEKRNDHSGTSP
jgi:hypothetical protein